MVHSFKIRKINKKEFLITFLCEEKPLESKITTNKLHIPKIIMDFYFKYKGMINGK